MASKSQPSHDLYASCSTMMTFEPSTLLQPQSPLKPSSALRAPSSRNLSAPPDLEDPADPLPSKGGAQLYTLSPSSTVDTSEADEREEEVGGCPLPQMPSSGLFGALSFLDTTSGARKGREIVGEDDNFTTAAVASVGVSRSRRNRKKQTNTILRDADSDIGVLTVLSDGVIVEDIDEDEDDEEDMEKKGKDDDDETEKFDVVPEMKKRDDKAIVWVASSSEDQASPHLELDLAAMVGPSGTIPSLTSSSAKKQKPGRSRRHKSMFERRGNSNDTNVKGVLNVTNILGRELSRSPVAAACSSPSPMKKKEEKADGSTNTKSTSEAKKPGRKSRAKSMYVRSNDRDLPGKGSFGEQLSKSSHCIVDRSKKTPKRAANSPPATPVISNKTKNGHGTLLASRKHRHRAVPHKTRSSCHVPCQKTPGGGGKESPSRRSVRACRSLPLPMLSAAYCEMESVAPSTVVDLR